uniref:Uncharacterized protein n=1 Tax=Mola mola TaxID=94237 RepID=A0A3Q3VSU5_MOLML
MFSFRAAWQRCGPLARRAAYMLPRDGEFNVTAKRNINVFISGKELKKYITVRFFSPLSPQAYNTVSTDSTRFSERIAEIKARPKTEWVPKPWPPKSKCSFQLFYQKIKW